MKPPLRIIMVSGNTPPAIDGVCHYTRALLAGMIAQRPDWEWLWLGRRQRWFDAPLVIERNVRVVRPSHTWSQVGTFLASVPIRFLRPDILHIQDQVHSFHETGAAAYLAKQRAGRVVSTLHEFHVELPSVSHTVDLVRSSNVLIANDARTRERCVLATGRVPEFTWWSGSNVPPPEPSWTVQQIPALVTTFGLLSAIKMLQIVYKALESIRERRSDLRWQVIGPFTPGSNSFHADLQREVSGDWVRFTGAYDELESVELRTALSSSQIMVLPFADGASPRRTTLQTAWTFGLPVVTTPPEAEEPDVMDGVNCLLVREPTAIAWEEAIERILSDAELRGRLRVGSLATAERFRWSRLARMHIDLYESVARERFDGADARRFES